MYVFCLHKQESILVKTVIIEQYISPNSIMKNNLKHKDYAHCY